MVCCASSGSCGVSSQLKRSGSAKDQYLTRCPAASADMRLSSPARTVPQTILSKFNLRSIKFGCHMGMLGNYLASWLAFSPGKEGWGPFTPSISRHADCAGSTVPPPTVPTWIKPMFLARAILTTILTSILGMEQVMYRSSPVGPQGSIKVIQLELPTFWAASCVQQGSLQAWKHKILTWPVAM